MLSDRGVFGQPAQASAARQRQADAVRLFRTTKDGILSKLHSPAPAPTPLPAGTKEEKHG
jgi:hypothetical protein